MCPVLHPSGDHRVEVLDMNVHALRAPSATEKLAAARLGIDIEKPLEGSRLVCEPSVFPLGGVFAKEVVTGLPYYAVPAPGQGESYVGYMIDEQRLLGLKVRVPWVDAGPVTCRKLGKPVYGWRPRGRRCVHLLRRVDLGSVGTRSRSWMDSSCLK